MKLVKLRFRTRLALVMLLTMGCTSAILMWTYIQENNRIKAYVAGVTSDLLTISAATQAIYQALRSGTWIPGQRQRLRQLAPGTWEQVLASVLSGRPGRPDDGPARSAVEIAIYPDVVWLAARSLREHSAPP